MNIDFFGRERVTSQKLENYGRFLPADCYGRITPFGLSVIMSNIDNYVIFDRE